MTEDPEATDMLEAGRLLFARPFAFIKGCVKIADLPPADRLEIAFAGRSNVGKSSLINALVGMTALARTSNTPGRTQEINIFEAADAPLRIVDMPGYGFAKAPPKVVERWRRMRGAAGTLLTGHCIVDTDSGREEADVAATVVRFGDPTDAEIEAYVASGEPLAVAGAFTLAFVQQPSNTDDDTIMAPWPSVQVQDAAGNPVAFAGNITIALGNPNGTCNAVLSGTTVVATAGCGTIR